MGSIYLHHGYLLANFVCGLSHLFTLPPFIATQRSIQEVFTIMNHSNPIWTADQWEKYLRRNILEWPSSWQDEKDTAMIELRHPRFNYSLWDCIQMYQTPKIASRDTVDRVFVGFTRFIGDYNDAIPRLQRFVKHLSLFMDDSRSVHDPAVFFKSIFLKPRLRLRSNQLKSKYDHLIKIADKFTVPTVMRRFVDQKFFLEDLEQLDTVVSMTRAISIINTLQGLQTVLNTMSTPAVQLDFYLIEQTALAVELTVRTYMVGPLATYLNQIYVLPRTLSTCYVLSTNLAFQALKYAFLTEIVSPKVHKQQITEEKIHNRPWTFPIFYRTWLEGTTPSTVAIDFTPTTSITQHPQMKLLAIHQVLLSTIKLCYIIANKKLFNTWMEDSWKNSSDRCLFRWTDTMNQAMFSMEHAQFYYYYAPFFELMARVWLRASTVREMVLAAVQDKPGIDDYFEPRCSILAFVESFIFVRAKHAIRRDTIVWLYDLCKSALHDNGGIFYFF
jgi:hypothetical protein